MCILSDHNAVKLKTDTKQIPSKYTNSQILNILGNYEQVKEKNQERNKNHFLEPNENENKTKPLDSVL